MKQEYEIEYTIDELEDDFSNDDLLNIQSWGVDLSVQDLLCQYQSGDILKPELQRNYVWEKKEASRFIESLLLGLPVPSIFLANLVDQRRLIVDGFQRIMTLYNYVTVGKWSNSEEVFRLTNSSLINAKWRNKSYKELDIADQRRLRLYTLHAIVFEQKKPQNDSSLYQIFERINTSGKSLNPQEIRNCVYQGDMNSLILDLNKNRIWRQLYGNEIEDKRMLDVELILRFFTLNNPQIYNSTIYNISLKQELNSFMMRHVHCEETDEFRTLFNNTVEFIYDRFGEEAFYNLQNDLIKYRKRLYPTVFDALMISTAIAMSRGYVHDGSDLKVKKLELLKNQVFRESITQGTMQVANIKKRISMALSSIYNMEL